MKRFRFATIILSLFVLPSLLFGQSTERRQQYLEELIPYLRASTGSWANKAPVSPLDSTWEAWQKRTGELPPDFEQLPSQPFLANPLIDLVSGKEIETKIAWEKQRSEMAKRIQSVLTGTFPPKPAQVHAEILEEKYEGKVKINRVKVSFGENPTLSIRASIYYPPGEGPFPVFMTPGTKGHSWVSITQAISRGYIAVQYSGCDAEDDTEAFAAPYYPEYDFTTIMRRAWGAHRIIDYLYTLDAVDQDKIGITGLSRDGKQVLMAAAFDERIDAVVVCSGGTGGEDPFRYTGSKFNNETIEAITGNFPNWLHPRLRFYTGREDKLPFDQHFLSALVAPRGLLLSSSYFEDQGNPWAIEQHYDAAKPAFDFLDAGQKIGLHLRRGLHRPAMRDVQAYVDFFDTVFGRGKTPVPVIRYYDYSFEKWKKETGVILDPTVYPIQKERLPINKASVEQLKKETKEEVVKLLGEVSTILNPSFRAGLDYLDNIIRRPGLPELAKSQELHLGQLQYPTDTAGKPLQNVPVVIYLHEWAYPTGYGRGTYKIVHQLLEAGFAVYLQDQIGFGSRVEEGKDFYRRYPKDSKMGTMQRELSLAIDALEGVDFVNSAKIYAVGYSLGAKIGLWSAPFENRLAGMVAIAGFTPLRSAGGHSDIEGLKAYSHLHGLIPKLGFFIGEEERISVDYGELISCFAPKPLLLIAPSWDRDAKIEEVVQGVDFARKSYEILGSKDALDFRSPDTFNKFSDKMKEEVVEWLIDQRKK